jgi:hypothetical protein
MFEYACHEGNYGMFNMLRTARWLEQKATPLARNSPRRRERY